VVPDFSGLAFATFPVLFETLVASDAAAEVFLCACTPDRRAVADV
jgi:hypothetical protein